MKPTQPVAVSMAADPSAGAVPPGDREIAALLCLLDDDTPEVRVALAHRFAELDGDVSERLELLDADLDGARMELLSRMLAPGRRRRLVEEWQSPVGGAAAMGEDWEHLECLLRNLSDFLHDGVTIRQPLSDVLDLLSEEAEDAGVTTADELRIFLFEEGRYVANEAGAGDPRNLDLAWVADAGRSDALGLSMLYLLIARRLHLEVEAVDYPGHFFCRIHEEGNAYLIDCFDFGRPHMQTVLLNRGDIGRSEKQFLSSSIGPGGLLLRVLVELGKRLEKFGRAEDAELIGRLRGML
jgi:hypothetical protein